MNRTVMMKPVATAPIDRNALRARLRSVKSVIAAAANSGRNRIHQANDTYSNLISAKSEFHARQVFHMRRLPAAIEGDDERQADGDLRRSNRDDKKHHHLAIELV